MQRMKMRMKLPFKHDTRYTQHFAKAYSEPCQVSEVCNMQAAKTERN